MTFMCFMNILSREECPGALYNTRKSSLKSTFSALQHDLSLMCTWSLNHSVNIRPDIQPFFVDCQQTGREDLRNSLQ